MDNRIAWVWLSLACGAGSRAPVNLLRVFSSAENILKADRKTLSEKLDKPDMGLLSALSNKDTSEAQMILKRCDENNVLVLTPADPRYPRALYQLRDAPCVLYAIGYLPDFEKNCCCAVVGTRKMSDYGKGMAYSIGRGLGAGGAVLVSGLALGVDGMAMAGALSAGGTTVGVLGCGIDIVYPGEHKELFSRVIKTGAIITEYPPGTPPSGRNFPIRNRIISGLSDAVVIVEGDLRSGALITARHALYQGRELYAVPGRIGDAGAAGTNLLIKTGAQAITDAVDVLKNYEFIYPHSVRVKAAETAMEGKATPEDVTDVAVRMNVSTPDGPKYYGQGNYGGKKGTTVPRETPRRTAKPKKEKNLPSKKVLARFDEHKAEAKRNMIPANPVAFDLLDDSAKNVYAAMTADVPCLADDIRVEGLSIPDILTALTLLELCGAVECTAGNYYVKRSLNEILGDDSEKE